MGGFLLPPPPRAARCQHAGSGVLQWGTLKLPSPMPSLALCFPSLTKSLSCLMTALINEFISGPACPSGGPKKGARPLELAQGLPTL